MCISLAAVAIASVAVSAVQTGMSFMQANAQKSQASYLGKLERKQITERGRIERLAAIESENLRRTDFARTRSAALAAIGASGLGEHISFFQGADHEQQAALLRDVRNIRLGLTQSQSDARDAISVSRYGVSVSRFNAGQSKIGAFADFAKTAMSAATFAQAYGTPKAAAIGGGPTSLPGGGSLGAWGG